MHSQSIAQHPAVSNGDETRKEREEKPENERKLSCFWEQNVNNQKTESFAGEIIFDFQTFFCVFKFFMKDLTTN